MLITETIPSVLTWEEIKDHINLYDNSAQAYCLNVAKACVNAFEKETQRAIAVREIEVVYSEDDLAQDRYELRIPKGPVVEILGIFGADNEEAQIGEYVGDEEYELRQVGKVNYIKLFKTLTTPITLTYSAGHSEVPWDAKQALLLHIEHLYRNRGATTTQTNTVIEFGLERTYKLFKELRAFV